MNETEIINKLNVIETYVSDQDQDINNMELMNSKLLTEVQHMRTDMDNMRSEVAAIKHLCCFEFFFIAIILGVSTGINIKKCRKK